MSSLTWDSALQRLVAEVPARWRTTTTVVFGGTERMRVNAAEVAPNPQDIVEWSACPGAPSTVLANGQSHDIEEGIAPRTIVFHPLHSGGVKCGRPGEAILSFPSVVPSNEQQLEGLLSGAYTFDTGIDGTIHIVIAIRDEGGAGGGAPSAEDRTNEILKALGLTVRVTPGGHVVVKA